MQNVMEASEKTCACCGRPHRKLRFVDGRWLGANCADSYKLYCQNKDVTSIYWRGYEKQFNQVKRMVENG